MPRVRSPSRHKSCPHAPRTRRTLPPHSPLPRLSDSKALATIVNGKMPDRLILASLRAHGVRVVLAWNAATAAVSHASPRCGNNPPRWLSLASSDQTPVHRAYYPEHRRRAVIPVAPETPLGPIFHLSRPKDVCGWR